MTSSQKEFLIRFGWDDFSENQLTDLADAIPARVINEERGLYRVQIAADESIWANVSGKMQFSARGRIDFPAVGDWVLLERSSEQNRGVIRSLLKRKTMLSRKQVGSSSDVQILSANVNTVFIATSMNAELNIGRLERYLTFAWDSGATPVILLTKADLCEEVDEVITDLQWRFPAVEIFSLSKENFDEAKFLQTYLKEGTTSVLVGSSGVGKSTLTNFLVGKEVIATNEIRESDDKGKHTTTSRSMYESVYGGLIIDTPGMRELQFSDHEEGLHAQYGDIEELIEMCRYSNCLHDTEEDCAIVLSLEEGRLTPERWKSFKKIQGEIRHNMRKEHKWMLAEDRKVWKKRSMQARQKAKGW